jgi:CHASE3 domain sensor protein
MNIVSRPGLLRNLQIGFGLSLLILIITSVASYSSIRKLLDSSQWVDHTDSVLIRIDRVQSLFRNAESGQRGYLLTGDTTYLRAFYGAEEQINILVDSLDQMTTDNPRQGVNLAKLRQVYSIPLQRLERMVEQKNSDNIFNLRDIDRGRDSMRAVLQVLQQMTDEEHRLMADRVASVRRYSTNTPVLILTAALLSVLITLFFYSRVHRDFLERQQLYSELQEKDAEIRQRIEIIREIADQIAAGQYQTRVSDEQRDSLGGLSGSLNKMAESLDYSFGLLSDKEWLQAGIARLNEQMVGETDMKMLLNR